MRLKHWWMFSEVMAPLRIVVVWLQWKLRGHRRNHNAQFCPHSTKVWRWRAADGCSGLTCDWCHLVERWCPTAMPDLAELTRVGRDGLPDTNWRPKELEMRLLDALREVNEDRVGRGGRIHEPDEKEVRSILDGERIRRAKRDIENRDLFDG